MAGIIGIILGLCNNILQIVDQFLAAGISMSIASPSRAYRAWVLLMLGAMMACNYIDRSVLVVLIAPLKAEFQLTDTELGFLGGLAFALLFVAAGLPIARLSETRNRVSIIAVAMIMWSTMTVLCGMARTFVQLLIFRIGVGIGEAGAAPPSLSLISDYFPPTQRATAISIYSMGISAGTVLGSVLGGVIAYHFGWRAAFLLLGLPGLALAALLRLTVKEPKRGGRDIASLADSASGGAPPLLNVVRKLIRTASYRHIVIGATISNVGFQGIGLFAQGYFARRFSVSLQEIGIASGVIGGAAMALGTLAGGVLADWAGTADRRWYVWTPMVGLILSAPAFLFLYSRTSWNGTLVAMAFPTLFFMVVVAPMAALTQNLVAPRMRASAYALLTTVTAAIGVGLGPVFAGILSDLLRRRFLAQASVGVASHCTKSGLAMAHGGALSDICHHASVVGLQQAILILSILPFWAAFHYWRASRHIRGDLDGPVTA
jgi:MFS family permease